MEEVVEGDFVAPGVDRGGWEVFCVADEYAVFFEVDDGGVGGCVVEVAAKDDESLRVLCGEFGDDLLSVGGFGASACAVGSERCEMRCVVKADILMPLRSMSARMSSRDRGRGLPEGSV